MHGRLVLHLAGGLGIDALVVAGAVLGERVLGELVARRIEQQALGFYPPVFLLGRAQRDPRTYSACTPWRSRSSVSKDAPSWQPVPWITRRVAACARSTAGSSWTKGTISLMLDGLQSHASKLVPSRASAAIAPGPLRRYAPRCDLDAALRAEVSAAGHVGLVVPNVHPGIQGRVGRSRRTMPARLFSSASRSAGERARSICP